MIGELGILFLLFAAIGSLFVVGALIGDAIDHHQERLDARRRNPRP